MKLGPNATVVGTLSDEILNRTVTVAFGQNRQDKNWQNVVGPVSSLLEFLTEFQVGEKDGMCILQGELVGTQRIAKNVARNHFLIIDIDTGMSVKEVGEIVYNKGLFAILWTTHSFGKASTEISEEHFLRWCKKGGKPVPSGHDELAWALGSYLKEDKRYRSSVFDTFTYEGRKLVEGGIKYVVKHAPMPKLRVMFLLKDPFDFTEGASQKTRIEEWKKAYVNASAWLNVAYDSSCVDPSRLMYSPRVPACSTYGEDQHEVIVFAGEPLDIMSLTHAYAGPAGDMMKVLEDEGVTDEGTNHNGERHTFKTKNLTRFAKACPDFDIIGFVEAIAPDDRRAHGDGDKVEWACPNEESHTAMKADDRAFMVSTSGEHWYAGCLHDGCKIASRDDRLWYLDLLCQRYGIEDARELEAWSAIAQGKQIEASVAANNVEKGDHAVAISNLSPASSPQQISAALKMLGAVTDPIELDMTLSEIRAKTKGRITMGQMRKAVEAYAIEHKAALGVVEEVRNIVDNRVPEPENPDEAKEVWSHWAYRKQFHATRAIVKRRNHKDPVLFVAADGKPMFVGPSKLGMKMVDADADRMSSHLIDVLTFKTMDRMTGEISEERPPATLVKDLTKTLHPPWPLLERIAHTPIVAVSGQQIEKKGYIPELAMYLDPTLDYLPLPDVVNQDDIDTAVATLLEPLCDFPFSDAFDGDDPHAIYLDTFDETGHPNPNLERGVSSRANCLAFIMQPAVRHLISGPCPAYLIDKPRPGTGAGYLADIAFLVAQGSRAVAQTMSYQNEEFRKSITASLRDGSPIIFIDNINRKVDSGDLAAALTSGTWKDRILGESNTTTIEIKNTWVLAGNNISFTSELMRRIVPIRLDANTLNPALDRPKTAFKHNPLQDVVLRERAHIVWAINVLVKNWIDKGMKSGNQTMNSFDSYTTVMGGILEAAGIPGFLMNVPSFLSVKDDDVEVEAMVAAKIFDRFGCEQFTSAEALAAVVDPFSGKPPADIPIKTGDDSQTLISFGMWLSKSMVGVTFPVTAAATVKLLKRKFKTGSRYQFQKL